MGGFSCLGSGFRGFKAKLFAVEGTPSKPTCCSWLQRSARAGPCRETCGSMPLMNINGPGRPIHAGTMHPNAISAFYRSAWTAKQCQRCSQSCCSYFLTWTFRHDRPISDNTAACHSSKLRLYQCFSLKPQIESTGCILHTSPSYLMR